jgi:hypothetical protein
MRMSRARALLLAIVCYALLRVLLLSRVSAFAAAPRARSFFDHAVSCSALTAIYRLRRWWRAAPPSALADAARAATEATEAIATARARCTTSGALRSLAGRAAAAPRRDRIMCLVPTTWHHDDYGRWPAIMATWGGGCDALRLLVDAAEVPPPGAREAFEKWLAGQRAARRGGARLAPLDIRVLRLRLSAPDSWRNLWEKVRLGWLAVAGEGAAAAERGRGAEWFVKLDLDSFFSPRNLRKLVRGGGGSGGGGGGGLDPAGCHYLGRALHGACAATSVAHNSGAGYVLSAGALAAVAPLLARVAAGGGGGGGAADAELWDGSCEGAPAGVGEDVAMSACLRDAGVFAAATTRDAGGRQRFFTHSRAFEAAHHGAAALSPDAVLFHDYKTPFQARFFADLQRQYGGDGAGEATAEVLSPAGTAGAVGSRIRRPWRH